MSEIMSLPENTSPQDILKSFDPRSSFIPADLVLAIPENKTLTVVQQGRYEPLVIMAKKFFLKDNNPGGGVYHSAVKRGVIPIETLYQDFLQREVIEIYSEPLGGHKFIFDVQTGKRISPDDTTLPRDGLGNDLTDPNRVLRIFQEILKRGTLDKLDDKED